MAASMSAYWCEPSSHRLLEEGATRRHQAQSAGKLDGLGAAVRAELFVYVSHVRPDGVHRQVQLPGDLRGRKVGRQVPQHAGLAVAERRVQARWISGR